MIRAQAPCKVIITGEHGVVHGSPALAMAIEPFNTVTLTAETGPSQIILKLKGKEVQLSEKGEVINGGIEWKVYIDLIKHFIQNGLLTVKEKITIEIESSVPKGVGASSSVAVAMAVAVFKYIKKPLLKEALFEAGQFVDKIAHGELKWNFYPEKVSLPSGTELIVADTFKDGKRSGTGEMVKKVSKALGLLKEDESVKPLTEFTVADKKKIEQFKTIFQKIEAQLKPSGDAVELGKLMNKNHELLAKLSATTPGIEEARNICLENGAFGAKLTGAGGQGGAVIALIKKADAGNIIAKLKQNGFNAFEAKPTRGAAE